VCGEMEQGRMGTTWNDFGELEAAVERTGRAGGVQTEEEAVLEASQA
jgi:hypothetical protein